jgi:hypothetical protein
MKVIKRGKLPQDRAAAAAKKFSSRVVCDQCKSTLEFNANDLQTYCVPGQHKVMCPLCGWPVGIDIGGLPEDVNHYVVYVANGAMNAVELGD